MKWLIIMSLALLPVLTGAQSELRETVTAEVVEIESVEERAITGTGATTTVQTSLARITSGVRNGVVVSFTNDLIELEPGDIIFLNRVLDAADQEQFEFVDVDRRAYLLVLGGLFVFVLVLFAGMQGLRALGSLSLSVAAILFVLVPALLAGYDPALVSLFISAIILAIVLFGTHGVNPRSVIAFLGTFSAVLVTCVVAFVFVHGMRLTGFSSDASVFLNFSTGGSLDFAGLLLGSIIIGILGVLDDVSITQASVVQELRAANHTLGLKELYTRAIRVGRDHVGSLVNTLALAYVGVSLPLVLFLTQDSRDVLMILNQEIVAVELTRIIIGSIGLVLAVPLTTLAAAWWFSKREVAEDEVVHSHCGHRH